MNRQQQPIFIKGVIGACTLIATACGGDEGGEGPESEPDAGVIGPTDGGDTPDSGMEEPVPMRGWLNAQNPEDLSPDSLGGIRAGVTVRILDSEPVIEGVSGADGMWYLDVPNGVHMIHASTTEYWGAVIGTVFDRGNRYSNRRVGLYADLFIDDAATQLGRPIRADLGMVVVFVKGASEVGGESATISAEHDDAFVFLKIASDTYEVLVQEMLDENSPNVIFFPNVAPGWTTVSVQSAEGVNTCELEWSADEIPQWRVVAGSTTNIDVQCHYL